jgi:hypothetical protein
MYKQQYILEESKLILLDSLINEVTLNNKNPRIGISGTDSLSVYSNSRWKDWNRTQKSIFKSCFPNDIIDKSLIGWFLHIPKDEGFLDLMLKWGDQKTCGTIFAIALNDNQAIYLDGEPVVINRGQSIKFKLSIAHEILKSNIEQNWACVMILE